MTNDLAAATQEPVWRVILRFTGPLMLSNILRLLSGTLNSVFLGNMLGVRDLAAASAFLPGLIESEMLSTDSSVQDRLLGVIDTNVPMKRIGSPEEVARTVLWLCSSDARFVTGQALAVDGGWTARQAVARRDLISAGLRGI